MRILEFQVFILQCIQSRVFNLPHEMMLFKKKKLFTKAEPMFTNQTYKICVFEWF